MKIRYDNHGSFKVDKHQAITVLLLTRGGIPIEFASLKALAFASPAKSATAERLVTRSNSLLDSDRDEAWTRSSQGKAKTCSISALARNKTRTAQSARRRQRAQAGSRREKSISKQAISFPSLDS